MKPPADIEKVKKMIDELDSDTLGEMIKRALEKSGFQLNEKGVYVMRRIEVDKINLDAYDIEPFVNENGVGFAIKWVSDIGFGEYTIFKRTGEDEWHGDSEHMDNNEDKAFLKELMRLFIEQLDIVD